MITNKPFDDSQQKDHRRATENQHTNTAQLDPHRQGVELTLSKYYALGMVKIHLGDRGQSGDHQVTHMTLGQGRPRLRDELSFQESVKLNPLDRFENT